MDEKDNIKTIWLILALKKKFESRPYDLSSSELMLLKSYDMSISKYKKMSLYNTDPETPGLYYQSFYPIKVRKRSITLSRNRYDHTNIENNKNLNKKRFKRIQRCTQKI